MLKIANFAKLTYNFRRMKFNFKNYCGAAVAAAIAAVMMVSCNGDSNNEVQYIPVQITEGGAWSFINEKGERVGTQEWEFEPSVTRNGIFTARTDSGLTVYRWDKDVAKPIDSLRNLVSVGVYNDGLLPVTPMMQRIRIVDKSGKTKFELEPIAGQEISSCALQFSEGLLVVNTVDGKSGVIDKDGKLVVEPKYSEISNFKNGYALAVNYNYDNYEDGPSYFIIDKEGQVKPVKGKFGYEEGECTYVPEFQNGVATVAGPMDTVNYTYNSVEINVEGKVTPLKGNQYRQVLDNGAVIIYDYQNETSSYTWRDPEGKIFMKETEGSLNGMGKYVTLNRNEELTLFLDDGQELGKFKGNLYAQWPGGKFGPILTEYDKDYNTTYTLLDAEGKKIPGAKYHGVGVSDYVDLEYYGEGDMCNEYVTSAYVDVTAAATKLAQMAQGNVKGKEYYYLGQSVADILAGNNASYYSGSGRTFSLPTDSTGQLASGAGFWVSGTGKSSSDIVAPTYQHYFEVHHYDYYGRAWGWNRTRQVGVHFNSSAKVASFDIQLHTNHPSGARLREAVGRKMKADGYTLVTSAPNYDEYTNGGNDVIIYGTNQSHGVGAIVGAKSMSESEKSSLSANL